MSSVKEILAQIGIKITNVNSSGFAQFKPTYRNSNNPNGASIDLKSGWTTDWAEDCKFPIEVLVKKVTGEKLSEQDLLKFQPVYEETDEKEKTFWKEDALLQYVPNHDYWIKRGISKETLIFFKGGLSHGGKLYQRYVWPVYDRLNRIIGFTGRDITDESPIKYKHEGKSTEFLFGVFNKDGDTRPVLDSILETSHVILVEGPSDSVSAFDEGVKNVLPTVGLNISKTMMSFLIGVNPKKITLAQNIDENFSGQNAVVKNFAKLANHFDLDQIEIKYPIGNDLAENKKDIKKWLELPPASPLEEFREKYKRCEKAKKMKHPKHPKTFTQQEIKIGKLLSKKT